MIPRDQNSGTLPAAKFRGARVVRMLYQLRLRPAGSENESLKYRLLFADDSWNIARNGVHDQAAAISPPERTKSPIEISAVERCSITLSSMPSYRPQIRITCCRLRKP